MMKKLKISAAKKLLLALTLMLVTTVATGVYCHQKREEVMTRVDGRLADEETSREDSYYTNRTLAVIQDIGTDAVYTDPADLLLMENIDREWVRRVAEAHGRLLQPEQESDDSRPRRQRKLSSEDEDGAESTLRRLRSSGLMPPR